MDIQMERVKDSFNNMSQAWGFQEYQEVWTQLELLNGMPSDDLFGMMIWGILWLLCVNSQLPRGFKDRRWFQNW